MGIIETDPLSQLSLPPGFRFYPTDEELLVQYLCKKVAGHHFNLPIIGDIDLYKFDPWDLPSKAIFGEKEWYFFSPRDRKYPNGSRPNRVAGSGYWKATGTDKVITSEGRKVGIKKALVFYVGKAPKGTKTNWIMHEYRLSDSPKKHGTSRLDDWVLCRIYKKTSSAERANAAATAVGGTYSSSKEYSLGSSSSSSSQQYDDVMESLTDFDGRYFSLPRMTTTTTNSPKNGGSTFHDQLDDRKINLQQLGSGNFDWATLAGLNPLPDLVQAQQGPTQNPNPQLMDMSARNDFYTAGLPVGMDEEVQSGRRGGQRFDPSRSIYSNPTTDPFAIRYPTQVSGLGFRP